MDEEIQNVEETTENVEAQTTEEIEEGNSEATNEESLEKEENKPDGRFVTEEELNRMINDAADKRVARKMAKVERDYEKELSKYRDTENVLKKTLNIQDGEDVNTKLREYYEAEGIELPNRYEPELSAREIKALARDDAELIMDAGYEAMVNEAKRLADIGYDNLNAREKEVFLTLSEKVSDEKNRKELRRLGASEELLKDADFIKFQKKFVSGTPMEDILSLYKGNQHKPDVENPGSMKNNIPAQKETFTEEEISKMTSDELDDPKVWEKVMKSLGAK